ncbi:MAG: hypothetical protein AB1918_15930 [Pseudomonadota bacterium]
MTKRLPSSLSFPGTGEQSGGSARASLLDLTRTPALRLVLNVMDNKQPFAHCGVILHGRDLVGWISASAWEEDRTETYCYRAHYGLHFPGGRYGNTIWNNHHGFPETAAWVKEKHEDDAGKRSRTHWHYASFVGLLIESGAPVEIWKLGFGFRFQRVRRFTNADDVRLANQVG